jgi:hypothetical protein
MIILQILGSIGGTWKFMQWLYKDMRKENKELKIRLEEAEKEKYASLLEEYRTLQEMVVSDSVETEKLIKIKIKESQDALKNYEN